MPARNITKHAGAQHARITLCLVGSELFVSVCDDGTGIDVDTMSRRAASAHIGLVMMRETIALVGGEFEIAPGPDKGTRCASISRST